MLKYKKISETCDTVTYEYFPEGKSPSGIITYDKRTRHITIDRLASNDKYKHYAFHMIARLKKFNNAGEYADDGLVAWY